SELIEEVPGGLERYRPRLHYCLLDEMRMADSELESLRNLVAAVFRLEKSYDTEAMERVLEAAVEWLRGPGLEELRKSFTGWVLKVLLPSRVRGVRLPEGLNLEEVKAMLAESGFSWSDRWEREGMEKGLQQAKEDALAKARGVLLRDLASRFGPLPEELRGRVEAIVSIEELTELALRAGAASSLDDLANG
ncbi:MAG: transposase, partial [Thermoanaerobaculia bacterium]